MNKMDIFFNRRHTYRVNLPFEDVRENIQSIITKKWYDFSENISGRMIRDGEYIFYRKWTLILIYGSWDMPAYLKIKLIEENNRTRIETVLRPSLILVIAFYFIIALFFFALTGHSFIEGPSCNTCFLPVFDLVLFGIMMVVTLGLKNKFERIMHLQ